MTLYTIANPRGSVLAYLSAIQEPDPVKRESQFIAWASDQDPSKTFDSEQIFADVNGELEFDLEFLALIFTKLGWMPQYVCGLLIETAQELEANKLVRSTNGTGFSISELGLELYGSGFYPRYLKALSAKAEYWKDRNVKICGEANIGSGFFASKNAIVTCKHVVSDLDYCFNLLGEDGKTYSVAGSKRIRH
jgi:hypothetical protein